MNRTDLKIEDLQLSPNLKDLPMLGKYDEAVKQLLKQVFAGKVILAPYERAFELFITQEKETIKFPFISLFPVRGYRMTNRNFAQAKIGNPVYRQAQLYNSDTLSKEGVSNTMQNFYQYLCFDILYQIECWSTNRVEALQLVQELMFWLTAQGQVLVSYKEHKMTCNLSIDDSITDNSTYTDYENIGNIYRFTIEITIEAPVFRTQNYLNITSAEMVIEMKEDD